MRHLKAVLFDMDGTLMDTEPLFVELMDQTTTSLLGRVVERERVRGYIGPPLAQTMYKLAGSDRTLAARLLADYRRRYAAAHTRIQPFPGVTGMLKDLAEAGLRLAVATSKPRDRALALLHHHGLEGTFDAVAGAPVDEGPGSGKAAVIERALAELKISVPGAEAIMVGDRIFDVEGAAAHGVNTVLAAWADLADSAEQAAAWRVAVTPAQACEIILREVGV